MVNFLENWHMDRIFLFSALRKNSKKSIHNLCRTRQKLKLRVSRKITNRFSKDCHLKFVKWSLCFAKNREISPCINLETLSKSKMCSKSQTSLAVVAMATSIRYSKGVPCIHQTYYFFTEDLLPSAT